MKIQLRAILAVQGSRCWHGYLWRWWCYKAEYDKDLMCMYYPIHIYIYTWYIINKTFFPGWRFGTCFFKYWNFAHSDRLPLLFQRDRYTTNESLFQILQVESCVEWLIQVSSSGEVASGMGVLPQVPCIRCSFAKLVQIASTSLWFVDVSGRYIYTSHAL